MALNHMHLAVANLAKSRDFYATCFGFRDKECFNGMLFMQNDDGFVLALDPGCRPEQLPAWFHFGSAARSATDVRQLYESVTRYGARITRPLYESEDIVVFHCEDADGYKIEAYWERDARTDRKCSDFFLTYNPGPTSILLPSRKRASRKRVRS
jgi:predicted enzyme related to lactoylglutathione lyase